MAKTKWNQVKDKLVLVEGWARDGLTDVQIAQNLGISKTTFYKFKNEYSELSELLKKGKEEIDYQVENALLKRALGYNYEEVTYENGRETKKVTKQVAPDTTAQIFWLKNRKPSKWKDKIIDNDNNEAINNAKEILVKIRKVADVRNNN